MAEKNAEKLKINAEFLESDLFENVKGTYDVIVSNPPYIRTSVIETLQEEVKTMIRILRWTERRWTVFYRRIIEQAPAYLKRRDGFCLKSVLIRVRMSKSDGTGRIYGRKREKDLAGLDRVVFGVYDR